MGLLSRVEKGSIRRVTCDDERGCEDGLVIEIGDIGVGTSPYKLMTDWLNERGGGLDGAEETGDCR